MSDPATERRALDRRSFVALGAASVLGAGCVGRGAESDPKNGLYDGLHESSDEYYGIEIVDREDVRCGVRVKVAVTYDPFYQKPGEGNVSLYLYDDDTILQKTTKDLGVMDAEDVKLTWLESYVEDCTRHDVTSFQLGAHPL